MREIEKALDEVAREIGTAVREVQEAWQRKWASDWRSSEPVRSVRDEIRRVPDRVSDLAVGGSCAMRYLIGYSLKGLAIMQGVTGLFLAIHSIVEGWDLKPLCFALGLVATAQIIWWGGRLVHRSADRRRYARDQHRLIRLARERGGSLTVLEAAADCRMMVEKAEEKFGLLQILFPLVERSVLTAQRVNTRAEAVVVEEYWYIAKMFLI